MRLSLSLSLSLSLWDNWRNRFGCIVFCLLEVGINLLEHVNDFYLLALGRVMGGISTNILFTAFETWYSSHLNPKP
jgi:MFS transporter, MFS domain-containing protein family, molybdate-anion transporter